MPRISNQKKDKISEHILSTLLDVYPQALFTSEISKELARDEEFVKKLLLVLKTKNLVILVDKNPEGIKYSKRMRWRLSNKAHDIYSH